MAEITSVSIRECLNCGGDHKDVEVHRYNAKGHARDHPYFSHWGTCPVTGDPVPLCISPETQVSLPADALIELAAAVKAGRYMVAVWKLHGGRLDTYKLTHRFPKVDFKGALADLADLLRQEAEGPDVAELEDAADLPDRPLFLRSDGDA